MTDRVADSLMPSSQLSPPASASASSPSPASSRYAAVLVVSTSAAAGLTTDTTGPVIRDWLEDHGFSVAEPIIVADGAPMGEALRHELERGHRVVLTTGGTGVSPDDTTPEQTEPLLDVQLPGLMEALREKGRQSTPFVALTRGVAGFSDETFIMNLPGSRGGVGDGLQVLDGVLDHLLEQRSGGAGHGSRGTVSE